jgi:hypothetical protein
MQEEQKIENNTEKENTKTFASSLKSMDTEEWLDIHFTRKVGYRIAKIAMFLRITPNMITIASIFIGTFAGILFYSERIKINILGMLLLILANTFDSADGQLARMTNNKTRLGRILDGLAGDIWFITIYLVLTLRVMHNGQVSVIGIWAIAFFAGLSHILAASMADYYRNVHLFFVNGVVGSEHDNSKSLTKDLKEMSFWKSPFKYTCMWFYRNYTKTQEACSPNLQKFFKTLISTFGMKIPYDLRMDIREKNRKYMPLTNILQFNIRIIALFISLFLHKVWLYFVFDIVVINQILAWLIVFEERLFMKFEKKIKNGEYSE